MILLLLCQVGHVNVRTVSIASQMRIMDNQVYSFRVADSWTELTACYEWPMVGPFPEEFTHSIPLYPLPFDLALLSLVRSLPSSV